MPCSIRSLPSTTMDEMKPLWAGAGACAHAAPGLAALAKAITQAMQGLGMQGGRFEVALEKAAQPTQSGLEEVGFLVAGHPGSTPRPVGKVASGGELSRIALAIAVTTSQLGEAQSQFVGFLLRLTNRLGLEVLRAGKQMKAFELNSATANQCHQLRHLLHIDAKLFGAATHLHA